MNTPLEALERLKTALDIADRYAAGVHFGEGNTGYLSFADLRSLLSSYEAQGERLREVEGASEGALRFLDNAPLESGICCCGDPIAGHGFGSGHSPVDDLSYHSSQVADALRSALTQPPAMEKTDD